MPLILGTILPNILLGTVGSDTIRGLAGDDVIYGLDGDDLLEGGSGDDTLNGGLGVDTATYVSSLAPLVLNLTDPGLSTGDARGDVFNSIEVFELTNLADGFRGSSRAETVLAGRGNDTLSGLGGNDTLSGGDGNDRLIGGAGRDRLDGGTGIDVASYEGATVRVTMNLSTGVFSGDAAGDSLRNIERLVLSSLGDAVTLSGALRYVDAGAGQDRLTGSTLNDTMLGGAGRDVLFGGSGDDLLVAGNPASLLPGLDGDSLYGGIGDDTLMGGTGAAFLSGSTGMDSLRGEGGDDTLIGGAGADMLNGGAGIDTATYDRAVTLNLAATAQGAGDAQGDVLSGIEVIRFTNGISTYIGGSAAVTVRATLGAEVTAVAGSGAERFENMSLVSYAQATSGVTLTAVSASQINGTGGAAGDVAFDTGQWVLTGLADTFVMTAGTRADMGGGNDQVQLQVTVVDALLTMGSGNDTVSGDAASATMQMGAGNDTVTLNISSGVTVQGDADDDSLSITGEGTILIEGGTGNDTLTFTPTTEEASVTLRGDGGNDVLTGETRIGQLIVEGGADNDTLTATAFSGNVEGGAGADTLNVTILALDAGFFGVDGGSGDDIINMDQNAPNSVGNVRYVTIMGGAGNDDINGSSILAGSTGERFEFRSDWGQDTLSGFDLALGPAEDDVLLFRGVAGLNDRSDLVVTGDATQTLFTFGTNSILLEGFNVANAQDVPMEFLS